jgi:hypothetical protein
VRLILVLIFLLSVVATADTGSCVDPNGRAGTTLDSGGGMDPNGATSAVSTLAGDRGAGLDPNG